MCIKRMYYAFLAEQKSFEESIKLKLLSFYVNFRNESANLPARPTEQTKLGN